MSSFQVQNTVDDLNSKVKSVFRACLAKKGKTDDADSIFEEIRSTYYKALEDADEKVLTYILLSNIIDVNLLVLLLLILRCNWPIRYMTWWIAISENSIKSSQSSKWSWRQIMLE